MIARVFPITPPSAAPVWTLAVLIIVLVGLAAYFGWIAYSTSQVRVQVRDDGVRVAGSLYARFIPRDAFLLDRCRAVDLSKEPTLAPRLRTNGISLPGFDAGWYRLRGGGKALAFLTDRSHVALLPTTRNYVLLVSVPHPDELVQTLTALWRTR